MGDDNREEKPRRHAQPEYERYGRPVGVKEREDPKKAKLVEAILASTHYAELENDVERPGDPDATYLKKRKRKNPKSRPKMD